MMERWRASGTTPSGGFKLYYVVIYLRSISILRSALQLPVVGAVTFALEKSGASLLLSSWLGRTDEKEGQALLHEAEIYLELRKLWGTYVPRMLSCGTTCNGEMVFLATELLSGASLDDTPKGDCSPEVARKAKEALQAVHNAGLLHRNVDSRNFFVVDRGGTSGERGEACHDVFILDFGFSEPVRSQQECAEEMKELDLFL